MAREQEDMKLKQNQRKFLEMTILEGMQKLKSQLWKAQQRKKRWKEKSKMQSI